MKIAINSDGELRLERHGKMVTQRCSVQSAPGRIRYCNVFECPKFKEPGIDGVNVTISLTCNGGSEHKCTTDDFTDMRA